MNITEHAVSLGVDDEPVFSWWVPFILKKRDRIISTINTRYHTRTHKFGIEIPKSAEHIKRMDIVNGKTLWQDTIAKEIKALIIALKFLNGYDKVPPGHL